MTSISKMTIKGFRGVKSEVELSLPSMNSLLLYGDNGTGKSSILDAVEWFTTDKVSHLAGEEIETHGGLRYALNSEQDECSVELHFSNSSFAKKKSIKQVKDKLKAEFDDGLADHEKKFLEALSADRIWIRNNDLIKFVIGTKSQRLSDISSIIGFQDVSDTKAVLKKAANDLKGIIKSKNFSAAIASEQNTIAQNLGTLVASESQFVEAANVIVKSLAPDSNPISLSDLEATIKKIASKGSEGDVKVATALNETVASVNQLQTLLSNLRQNSSGYISAREAFKADAERLSKLNEKNLLDSALKLLENHASDNCPLCLRFYSREELKSNIIERLKELKQIREDFDALGTQSKIIGLSCTQISTVVQSILRNAINIQSGDANGHIESLKKMSEAISEVSRGVQHAVDQQIFFIPDGFTENIQAPATALGALASIEISTLNQSASSLLAVGVSKLSVAINSFKRIQRLTKEQNVLTSQANTLDTLASEFIKVQRNEMASFLNIISTTMNEYYLFMNPSEKVDKIQLVCLDDKSGEFVGLAVNFSFHGKVVDSPKKFLSESHLNALGLCLFLSTVRAFNRSSKFMILDDVISSFDKAHRTMFARLLVEKFSDLQLIILTHESEWYDYLSSLVRGKKWQVLKTNWSSDNGTVLSLGAGEIRSRIDLKIKNNDESDLGNLIRRYGERSLKEIAELISAPLAFKFNERNESRSFDEFYSSIRGYIKKKASTVADAQEISALSTCQFFSNKSSHDSGYNPNINDLKVALKDLDNFIDFFRCSDCYRFVSTEFENIPEKKITCRCGKKYLPWK